MTAVRGTFGPFTEQSEHFRQKVNLPTRTWRDITRGQHARAFVVAGAMRADMLTDFREAVDAAITDGETLDQFRARFDAIVGKYGWQYNGKRGWRTRVIYDTNMRTSFMAGRYAQMTEPDVLERHPYWQYQHNTVTNPREQHQAWNGLVLRHDDPWWDVHFPPNGWGCRCDVLPVSERTLRKIGKSGVDTAPPDTVPVPDEWRYNVGEAAAGKPIAASIMESEAGGRWTALDARGVSDYGRPASIPVDPTTTAMLPATRDPTELRRTFADLFGAQRLFRDPSGDEVLVSDALVDHWIEDPKRLQGRERFLPFLPDLIENPYEIWVGFARNELTGRVAIRRRYVKAVQVEKDRSIGLVAEAVEGVWTTFTMFVGNRSAQNNLRWGHLVWGRP
jgi:SPP1 gp7 family putative phage head morphogenesis protein